MNDLFPIPESPPPRIVKLRSLYDKAKAAYDEADAHEDESGEAVPFHLRVMVDSLEKQLRIEEARIAKL
jgi:hypothetical protein